MFETLCFEIYNKSEERCCSPHPVSLGNVNVVGELTKEGRDSGKFVINDDEEEIEEL